MKAIFYMVLIASALAGLRAAAADSLCASVKIEIKQELTMERQAFEAKMKISNGLTGIPLTDVGVVLSFEDADRRSVTFTVGDTYATNALFFVQNSSLSGFDDAAPDSVAGGTDAEIEWLIIPNPGAANDNSDGTLYYVGATLTYKVQGVTQTVTVSPDYIFVKPMPYLALDYFLPGQVYGDDEKRHGIRDAGPRGLEIPAHAVLSARFFAALFELDDPGGGRQLVRHFFAGV